MLQCVRDVGLSVACDSSIHESFLNNYIHDVNVIIILNFSRPRCLKNEKRRKNACTCVERMCCALKSGMNVESLREYEKIMIEMYKE